MLKSIGWAMGAGAAAAAGLGVAVVMLVPADSGAHAQTQGVQWASGTVDEALAHAGEKRVLVMFHASWCEYCKQLEAEVLDQREGGELTRDMVAVQVDFDAPENRPLVERYVVLGMPTVLVLNAQGVQVGRVMGYEHREEWVAEIRAAKTAGD